MGNIGANCAPQMVNDINNEMANMDEQTASAYGLIVGAWIGDAVGTTYEFKTKEEISEREVNNNYKKVPGGGYWEVGPGQITDDSELAISLMNGISNGYNKSKGSLNYQNVAVEYANWIKSGPFDIGQATRAALEPLATNPKPDVAIKAA